MADKRPAFYHNLSAMVGAGIPIMKALRSMASGVNAPDRNVILSASEHMADGHSFAEAMARFPKAFAPLDIMAVEAGEMSGFLAESFQQLSQWYTLRQRLMRTIFSGMVLPIVLIHVIAVIVPLPGYILGNTSNIEYLTTMLKILALIYVPVGTVVAVIRLTPPTGPLRRLFDAFTLRIPLLGRAIRHLALSRFCRAFHMLYSAGVPGAQCAQKATEVTGNTVMSDLLIGAAISAQAGNPLADGFSPRLPPEFRDSWRIGEESGKLDDITNRLADLAAENGERMLTLFCQWIPRLVYVGVCVFMIIMIFRTLGGIMGGSQLVEAIP